LGYVASVCPDGTPNLSPKGTTTVWDDQHLVFLDLHSPRTVGNIEAGNPVVEINVVDPILRKGYRFKGPAAVLRDGPSTRTSCASTNGSAVLSTDESMRS
jgi:predicted pyridoxine 5'-phosphate oxidase superfamily flavin-nucleotide-binding protein